MNQHFMLLIAAYGYFPPSADKWFRAEVTSILHGGQDHWDSETAQRALEAARAGIDVSYSPPYWMASYIDYRKPGVGYGRTLSDAIAQLKEGTE